MIEIEYDKVVHTSDHFEQIQKYTEQLIRQGDMFTDDTDPETVSTRTRHLLISGQRAAKSRDTLKESRYLV